MENRDEIKNANRYAGPYSLQVSRCAPPPTTSAVGTTLADEACWRTVWTGSPPDQPDPSSRHHYDLVGAPFVAPGARLLTESSRVVAELQFYDTANPNVCLGVAVRVSFAADLVGVDAGDGSTPVALDELGEHADGAIAGGAVLRADGPTQQPGGAHEFVDDGVGGPRALRLHGGEYGEYTDWSW